MKKILLLFVSFIFGISLVLTEEKQSSNSLPGPTDRTKTGFTLWTGKENTIGYEVAEYTQDTISVLSGFITIDNKRYRMLHCVFPDFPPPIFAAYYIKDSSTNQVRFKYIKATSTGALASNELTGKIIEFTQVLFINHKQEK